jgi:HK97 family phage portal protein
MGLFGRMMASTQDALRDADSQRWWASTSSQSDAGIAVTAESSMEISTVWACTGVISTGLASMPIILYERLAEGGKDRALEHALYEVLHVQPNNFQTILEWVEMMLGHAVLRGNGYSEIIPGRRGAVDQLIPLHPTRVTPKWGRNYSIVYEVLDADGSKRILLQDEVFHLRGRSNDGLVGMSVVTQARNSLGLARATERFGSKLFANGARPAGILKHPSNLSEQAQKRLIAQIEDEHRGASNAGKTLFLEEGLSWEQVGMSSEDAQFLETRKFQRNEIASWFGVKPHKIGDLERATFSNIEHQSLEHVTDTLLPWARRIELLILTRLIQPHDRKKYFAEFLFDALLRGDTKTRFDAYAKAVGGPIMTPNEARGRENMNPIEGGDELQKPMNMTPVSEPEHEDNDDGR